MTLSNASDATAPPPGGDTTINLLSAILELQEAFTTNCGKDARVVKITLNKKAYKAVERVMGSPESELMSINFPGGMIEVEPESPTGLVGKSQFDA